MLTVEQKVFIVQCYGSGDCSYRYVAEEFRRKFPGVYVSKVGVHKLVKKFQRTGSVVDIKKEKKQYNEDDACTVLILQSVNENPLLSLRNRAKDLEVVKKSTIQKVLKENKIYPYKPIFNQTLEVGDEAKRLDYCLWVGNEILNVNRNFHKLIMFSDESTFSTNGTVASQHVRYWSKDNPEFRIPARSQYFKKVNVWCAISYYGIIGPYFFEGTCNRASYLQLLDTFFCDHLEDLPLDYRNAMYFQHDGCPAHCAGEVREWLNTKFGERWIGRNGPVLFPPRSPDLTLADSYLWGRVKQLTFAQPMANNVEILKLRIRQAVESLSIEEIQASFDHIRKQMEKCVEYGGAVFEQ